MDSSVIKIEDAVVSYREDVALRGVSFEVESGEFVGIVGPNGAGKTTLLTIVNGLGKLLSGRVQVMGDYVNASNGHELRKKVGYVPQLQNIDPRMPMSVREVVMTGRYGILGLFHRPGKADWHIVDEVLELVGMTELAQRPIGNLSGGEQQRVAIARAVANAPRVLFADEPTGNLDPGTAEHVFQALMQLVKATHVSMLIATHNMELAGRMDRRVSLANGQVVELD